MNTIRRLKTNKTMHYNKTNAIKNKRSFSETYSKKIEKIEVLKQGNLKHIHTLKKKKTFCDVDTY